MGAEVRAVKLLFVVVFSSCYGSERPRAEIDAAVRDASAEAGRADDGGSGVDGGGSVDAGAGLSCGAAAACAADACRCDGLCARFESDPDHCGECAVSCDAETPYCVDGVCVACPEGLTACEGRCVSTRADSSNCGACGNACGDGPWTCIEGECSPCPVGQTECGGVCVNTLTDSENCGACGDACTPGSGSCSNGTCTCGVAAACEGTDESYCCHFVFGFGDFWRCRDQTSDETNCGACNRRCGVGEACVDGVCG